MKRLLLILALCVSSHAAKYGFVFVPDIQNLTATGGNAVYAEQKTFNWIINSTASTFGSSIEGVFSEGDEINTTCNFVSGTWEDNIAFARWNTVNTAGIRWSVNGGNHVYVNAGISRSITLLSESWKNSPNLGTCSHASTPGDFSPQAFVSRNLGFTSESQFWAMGGVAGVNQNSYMRWVPSGYHGVMVMQLNLFATQGELDAAGAFLTANPHDDVFVVCHACLNATNNTDHIAAYQDYTDNSTYSLDSSNSRSGQAILAWAKGFPNIVAIIGGHNYPSDHNDGSWSTRTDTANDGHQIIGIHADWQNLDTLALDSSGANVGLAGGGGTCPQIGSTGCTAEVGFVLPLVIDTTAHTASFYALSTNTGHWVATGNALPQPGNTMTPIASFSYTGTPQSTAADFSFIVIPDPHMGAGTAAEWVNQQQWIAANQTARKIEGVFYVGDLEGLTRVWDNLSGVGLMTVDAMGVPWGAAPGNHDYDTDNVPADRHTSTFDARAGYSRISGKSWYGGYWTGDPGGYKANQYILFSVGPRQFLVLFLEFYPRLAANPSREVLIITHSYVDQWGNLGDRGGVGPDGYSLPSTDAAGTDIEAWAAGFANVRAIFGGHYFNTVNFSRHRTDTGTHGNPMHGIFANYQDGGKQYVVLAEFTGNNVTFSQMNTTTGVIDSTTFPPYTLAWAASGDSTGSTITGTFTGTIR